MSERANQKEAEELLEKALSAFGECEPPPDLEDKILSKVRSARTARRSAIWLPLGALAAALLIGVVLIKDWRSVEAPTTTVAELPASPARRPLPESVGQPVEPSVEVPSPLQKRPIARTASPAARQNATEESAISPLPQSKLALSDITSSPIEIEELGKEATPLVSELAGAGSHEAPATELTSDLTSSEEGREQ